MTIQIEDTELRRLLEETASTASKTAVEKTFQSLMEKYNLVPKKEIPLDEKTNDVSDEDIANMMEVMRANMGTQENPKVGIFWYQMVGKRLFGVIAVDKDSIKKPNVGGGLITCYELHRDVWKKKFKEQKYKNNGQGPYIGDYKDHARGRVFYNPRKDQYTVTVGSWIDECPEAKEMIVEEFNLKDTNFKFEKNIHWEIGNGWENS